MDAEEETMIYRSGTCSVFARELRLNFKYPFRLAHGSRDHTSVVMLRIEHKGMAAFGEASLPPYLGLTAAEVIAFFRALPWQHILDAPLAEALSIAEKSATGYHAAKAALDIALHDFHGKLLHTNVSSMYRIQPQQPIYTTFTIGISTEAELLDKLREAADFKIIKLKLGSADDKTVIDAFLKHSAKAFCVDVNQGWHDRSEAARLAEYLTAKGALFIEQPMPVGREDDTAWLRERVSIPIMADESVKRLNDLDTAATAFDGVNIKLMKSTGIAEAFEMVKHARSLGLKVVLGAMAESSCAVTAAAHLAPLADWVDLDGPLLISNDPFTGISYHQGQIILPKGEGIGALPKA